MGLALQKKDLVSSQEVRWCPGCGDYAILAAMQKTLPELGVPRENIVFISGIGCSSRFPYYMNTYGFHTIHGRAPAFATGLALCRPDLSIWVITGDGDALSIGANHLIHSLRRNININIILFNNQTYGLTKGQYSPTSHQGTISKSTPFGSIDRPFSPLALALGAGATFVARTYDKNQKHMSMLFKRAAEHQGSSFIEIYQNCPIFNDKVFENTKGEELYKEHLLFLEEDQELRFGKEKEKLLYFQDFEAKALSCAENTSKLRQVHREAAPLAYAFMLSQLSAPDFPEPMGVLHCRKEENYEAAIQKQEAKLKKNQGLRQENWDINALLQQGDTWEVH